jgi:tripartite-type tricarboxylate transporter receptor subunit TctC
MPNLPFDPVADLAPISLIARTASIVLVPAQSPIASVADLVAAAKAADGKMRYVSSGLGTSFHLVAELFSRAADVRLTHVQKGSATETITALTAGEADVVFANAAAALPAVRNGHAKAVAVTASTRARYLPDVPAVAETLPGFEGSAWFGFFVTAKTPPDLLGRLRQDVGGAIRHPEVANSIRDAGAEPVGSTADELADVLRADLARWERIIREAGISPR